MPGKIALPGENPGKTEARGKTLPAGGRKWACITKPRCAKNSNPRPPEGGQPGNLYRFPEKKKATRK